MKYRCAILDDYQNVALSYADWSKLAGDVEVKVFNQPFKSTDEVHRSLKGFEIIAMMRERTAFLRNTIEALPDLKLLITTGAGNKSIDLAAAAERGVTVAGTGTFGNPTTGIAFGLILELTRRIGFENARMKAGAPWQVTIGHDIEGMTLGIIGLGKLGAKVARLAQAFGMNVIAWSPNLTPDKCKEAGVTYASKEELFKTADVITIHVVLGPRSRGLVGREDLLRMKPTAYIVNTARGPIIDEAALLEVLQQKKIAGAGIDVLSVEPLPVDHPFRKLDNMVITPHLGYATEEIFSGHYTQMVEGIDAWFKGEPLRRLA